MTEPLTKSTKIHIKHFFKQLSDLPYVWEANGFSIQDLPLAFIEKNSRFSEKFNIRVLKCDKNHQPIQDEHQLIEDSEFRHLELFCKFPSEYLDHPNTIQYKEQSYFARPLSLWLSPVAFLLVPPQQVQIWENAIIEHSEFIQGVLLHCLCQKIEDFFNLNHLAEISKDELYLELAEKTSSLIMPREWTFGETTKDYAQYLFSGHDDANNLQIKFPNETLATFFLPPILPKIKKDTSFAWAYRQTRLDAQKKELSNQVNTLIIRILARHENLQKLLSEENKIPNVSAQVAEIKITVGQLNEQLEKINYELEILQQQRKVASEKSDLFYTLDNKKFTISFRENRVNCISSQACRLIHTLLMYPNQPLEMYLLYAYSKGNVNAEIEKKKGSNHVLEKKKALINYLQNDLIQPIELRKAVEDGSIYEFKKRLEVGIHVLEQCVKEFPTIELQPLLNNYRKYNDEYFGNLSESGFETAPLRPEAENDIGDKKRARQRLQIQFKSANESLKNNKNTSFARYLELVIDRNEENGVHYYTFRPQNAGKEDWKNIQWRLYP